MKYIGQNYQNFHFQRMEGFSVIIIPIGNKHSWINITHKFAKKCVTDIELSDFKAFVKLLQQCFPR